MEQNALLRHGAALRHQPGTLIQGKELGVAGKAPGPLQIDVSAAAAQITRNVVEGPQFRVPEERPRRVAAGGWCRSVRQNRESYVSPQNAFSMYSYVGGGGECAPSV